MQRRSSAGSSLSSFIMPNLMLLAWQHQDPWLAPVDDISLNLHKVMKAGNGRTKQFTCWHEKKWFANIGVSGRAGTGPRVGERVGGGEWQSAKGKDVEKGRRMVLGYGGGCLGWRVEVVKHHIHDHSCDYIFSSSAVETIFHTYGHNTHTHVFNSQTIFTQLIYFAPSHHQIHKQTHTGRKG